LLSNYSTCYVFNNPRKYLTIYFSTDREQYVGVTEENKKLSEENRILRSDNDRLQQNLQKITQDLSRQAAELDSSRAQLKTLLQERETDENIRSEEYSKLQLKLDKAEKNICAELETKTQYEERYVSNF
jgi:hypothetical protein